MARADAGLCFNTEHAGTNAALLPCAGAGRSGGGGLHAAAHQPHVELRHAAQGGGRALYGQLYAVHAVAEAGRDGRAAHARPASGAACVETT
jgi:hypothetical protein